MKQVIAVAAPIGGGKTSLVNAIARVLGDATTLFYDNYEQTSKGSMENLAQWIKNGAEINDFLVPRLVRDLAKLKQGEWITDPSTNMKIPSRKYIIFEMPFGKAHRDTAQYIDLLVWIEIPLDIALARKIKELTANFLKAHQEDDPRVFILWLNQYIENYVRGIRDVLLIQKEKVSIHADIIVNGLDDFGTMVEQAVRGILKRMP